MQATKVVLGRGSVSTSHGQQRILKHSTPDVLTYIQKAVQTGIYRSNEEIEEMNQRLQENPMELRRIRWNVNRGSKIEDYPKEYEILSLNPPAPFRPRMPLKDQRKAANRYIQEHRPTDRLARSYLNRQQQKQQTSGITKKQNQSETNGAPATAEEYYERLLGAKKAPKMNSAMGSKSAMVNKAYAFAVKQYHLMRTENLTEQDALDQVDELLKDQDVQEKTTSRTQAETVAQQEVAKSMPPQQRAETVFPRLAAKIRPTDEDPDDAPLAMLYSNQQRAFEGMISWTQRLQAVPYRQWTVGASVAMDHWIAKRVLGLSEETWLALLEGESPELMGRGRDIVMARHALFPETILEEEALARQLQDENVQEEQQGGSGSGIGDSDELDELLKTLGGWNDDAEDDSSSSKKLGFGSDDSGDNILQLTEQLQEWRAKHVQAPYEEWSDDDKKTFTAWLQDYVATLTPESSLGKVDMEGTRKALLASPPQSKEDSDQFWDSIRDETAAEVLLQQLLAAKEEDASTPSAESTKKHAFWQLDYAQQLDRLVQLGSIRSIADEYASEQDRSQFLARYGDALLEGLELDHLVVDPTGPIRGSDLGERLRKHYNIGPHDRFRLEQVPYGTDAFGTSAAQRARDVYRAWNQYKTGRAHYEEKLFQSGLLGLTYDPKDAKKKPRSS